MCLAVGPERSGNSEEVVKGECIKDRQFSMRSRGEGGSILEKGRVDGDKEIIA